MPLVRGKRIIFNTYSFEYCMKCKILEVSNCMFCPVSVLYSYFGLMFPREITVYSTVPT